MKHCLLVDSSVWIAATRRGGDESAAAELGELLTTGRAAMTQPIWLELFQGIKSKQEEQRLVVSKKSCVWLDFDDACWNEAAKTARACQRAGVNVPFGDVLVYACATRYGVELLEKDRHFAMIRKVIK